MKILGLSALFHDASAAFIEDEKIVWAGHAERYDACVGKRDQRQLRRNHRQSAQPHVRYGL